jgi:8-oxo-dGTP pyrophosphatase MutT (NUDIX family)
MSRPPFRRLNSRVIYKNPWIQLEQHEVEVRASGHRFPYTYLASKPSVIVVALTAEGKVVLVRQYRYPRREFAYELPGGGTHGNTPRQAAREELRQETGYRAAKWSKAGEFVVYCGLSDELCHVYVATQLRPGTQTLEETEHISVHEVSRRRLQAMIRSGEFRDGMGLAALRIAAEKVDLKLHP